MTSRLTACSSLPFNFALPPFFGVTPCSFQSVVDHLDAIPTRIEAAFQCFDTRLLVVEVLILSKLIVCFSDELRDLCLEVVVKFARG